MPGATTSISGSTGPAPTTVWFATVPDRLSMLCPLLDNNTSSVYTTLTAVTYVKDCTPWNLLTPFGGANSNTVSFGAFTTAPDGTTNTAQKMVESTDNCHHFCSAGFLEDRQQDFPYFRVAGFFKAAERTRVMLTAVHSFTTFVPADKTPYTGTNGGVKAIFDLAGGQIALDATRFGPAAPTLWSVRPATMIHYGDGWYLCFFDFKADLQYLGLRQLFVNAVIDNGSGLAAQSTQYAGDGTSGVYGWRINLMPPGAWALSAITLFDDFDSTATIDLANTLDTSKKWFIGHKLPYISAAANTVWNNGPTNTGLLSCSGSILTMTGATPRYAQLTTYAFAAESPIPQTWVGRGFKIPAVFEFKVGWDYTPSDWAGMWVWTLEYVGGHPNEVLSNGALDVSLLGREMDFSETFYAYPLATLHDYFYPRQIDNQGQSKVSVGMPPWDSGHAYFVGDIVSSGGNFYVANAIGTNHVPPNASFWNSYSAPPPGVVTDFTQLHTFSTLMLPYVQGDYGIVLHWMDGIYANMTSVYGPTVQSNGSKEVHPTDGQTHGLQISGMYAPNNARWDWVRITQ